MKVLVVALGYPTDKYPGNGIFEFDQARALTNAGHKVVFVAVDLRSIRRWRKWGTEHFVKDGMDVYAINIPLGRVPHSLLASCGKWGIKKLYRKIVKEHGEPDIIHAHFLGEAEIALALKPLTSAKFVMTEHSSSVNMNVSDISANLLNIAAMVYQSYDDVITVSPAMQKRIYDIAKVNTKCIPNIVDLTAFGNISSVKHDCFNFTFVGNMISLKNPQLCITAFAKSFQNQTAVTLTLIGGGSELNKCKKLVKDLSVADKVKILGVMPRNKIAGYLASSDCFVLPSQAETFGVVYIEAMSCGLPVIATRCGGPESFVNESNGVLIPVNDEQALVDAFRYMFENAKKYDSAKISAETIAKFSPQAIADQLTKLYSEVLKQDEQL
ncbi:MAG: glycosyltransferase [Synergistes sp.]|nr:glycosyltransferase [Synergistes sp.]